jgi:hypothetical protein
MSTSVVVLHNHAAQIELDGRAEDSGALGVRVFSFTMPAP